MTEGRKKILVMDDEEIVCDIAEQMLIYLGYIVETAADGKEAIKLYEEHFDQGNPFSIVIMDLNVPEGMGGGEAAELFLDFDPKANLVLSSGYANDPMMLKYKEHGFRAAIAKPFDLEGLKAMLEEAL